MLGLHNEFYLYFDVIVTEAEEEEEEEEEKEFILAVPPREDSFGMAGIALQFE